MIISVQRSGSVDIASGDSVLPNEPLTYRATVGFVSLACVFRLRDAFGVTVWEHSAEKFPFGDAWVDVTAPSTPGDYTLTGYGALWDVSAPFRFTVTKDAPKPPPKPGGGTSWLTYAALGAIAVLIIVLVIRR